MDAATLTWLGGDGNWGTGNNWISASGTGAAPGDGDTAVFNDSGNANLNVSGASATVSQILFGTVNTGPYVLGSPDDTLILGTDGGGITVNAPVINTQTLNAWVFLGIGQIFNLTNNSTTVNQSLAISGLIDALATSGTQTLRVGGAGNTVISGSIINDQGSILSLSKTGAGTLILLGSNSMGSGTWQIGGATANNVGNYGAVRLASNNALGNYTTVDLSNVGGVGAVGRIELTGGVTISGVTLNVAGRGDFTATGVDLVNVSGSNTWAGNIMATQGGGGQGIRSEAGLLTLSGTVGQTSNNKGFWVGGPGDVLINGSVTTGTFATLGLTKFGSGTLTITGPSNLGTGATVITGGTLNLDFGQAAVTNNLILSTGALQLGGFTADPINGAVTAGAIGGALNVLGRSGTNNSQSFGSLAVNAGASALTINGASGNSTVLSLGAISRAINGTVDFTLPTGAQSSGNGFRTTSINSNGILGGWATVSGTDWASVTSGSNIVGLSVNGGYTNDTWSAANNTTVTTNSSVTAGSTTNSLRFNAAVSGTIMLGGNASITSGGILVTSNVGPNISMITSGTLLGASAKDLVVIQSNTNGGLTIFSPIGDNGTSGLTKSGPGLLTLTGSNSFKGITSINAGSLVLGNAMALQNSTLLYDNQGGTISFGALSTASIGGIKGAQDLPASALTSLIITNGAGGTAYYGAIRDGSAGPLSLTKAGSSSQTMGGANTYTGTTTLAAGTLILAIGDIPGISGPMGKSGPIAFNGGTLQYMPINQTDYSSRVSNAAGQSIIVNPNAQSVTWASPLSMASGTLQLSGAGTLTLAGANTYTSVTLIKTGILNLGSVENAGVSGPLGVGGSISFSSSGVLQYSIVNSYDYSSRFAQTASQTIGIDTNGQNVSFTAGLVSSGGTLTKTGAGTLTLGGSNNYSSTVVKGGTLLEDFNLLGATPINRLAPTGTLSLSGGTFKVLGSGSSGVASSQTLASMTVTANSASALVLDANTGSGTVLNVGAVTRNTGGTVDFTLPSGTQSASNGFRTSTGNLAGSTIIGGYATVSGTDWASVNNGNIVGLSANGGYVNDAWAAGNNTTVVSGSSAVPTSSTTDSLRFNTAVSGTVSLAGLNTISTGGVLVTGNVGANPSAIVSGTLVGPSGGDLTIIQNNASSALTIGSVLADNNTSNLVKSGTGTLSLTAANTYKGTTYLNAGILNVTSNNNLGSPTTPAGSLLFNGGTLQMGANNLDYSARFSTAGNQPIRIDTNGKSNTNVNSGISGVGTSLTKLGAGTLILNVTADTYTGPTNILGGTIQLVGILNSLGVNSAVTIAAGATFDCNGLSNSIGSLSGGGTVTTGTQAGTTNVATLTTGGDGTSTSFSGVVSGAGNFVKINAGTQTLSGVNTYSGLTTVSGGKLLVSGSLSGTPSTTVAVGATLAGGNNLTSSIGNVIISSDSTGGGTLAPGDTLGTAASIGRLTISGGLTLGDCNFSGKAHLAMEIGATTAGTGYDQISISGPVALNQVSLDGSLFSFTPVQNSKYFLIVGSSGVTGTFANQNPSDAFSGGLNTITFGGQEFAISYSASFAGNAMTGGNDVALMAIPEPQTMALLVTGLGTLFYSQRRRRRSG